MTAILIVLNQSGKTPGVAGKAREDLVTGVPVQATIQGGPFKEYLWTLIDNPVDFVNGVRSSAAVTLPKSASTTIQPIDIENTYLLQVLVDSGQGLGATADDVATITFYAGTPLSSDPASLPQRTPAFGERLEHNVTDAILQGNNSRGWAQVMGRWFEIIKSAWRGSARTWARIHLTSGGASLLQQKNVASVTRISRGVVDVTFIKQQSTTSYGLMGTANGGGGSVSSVNETRSSVRILRGDPFGTLVDADFTIGVLET